MAYTDQSLGDYSAFAYAGGKPTCRALIKTRFEDFIVEEDLGFEPTGAGEHLFLKIRKQDLGTIQVVSHLADKLGIASSAIGYSGMKDRRAVCTQWFSVPKNAAHGLHGDASSAFGPGLELLETRLNDRKLRLGSHRSNHFLLCLRDFNGDLQDFQQRVESAQKTGVPNYFGPQRLGRAMSNVLQAQETFRAFDENREGKRLPRKRKSMLLSACRSFLFNKILSRRVTDANWNRLLAGEVLNLAGTKRFFKASPGEMVELRERLDAMDIHATGLLAGNIGIKDSYAASDTVAQLEADVLSSFPVLIKGLSDFGVTAARRALRLVPDNLEYAVESHNNTVRISFSLTTGGYATALLRELVQV